tara:strand:- start:82 stop:807 length:726 start_codon:yes stop_codon:yes gene_type:complete
MDDMVSVIIPTYNGKKFIQETIESAVNQRMVDEVIIIDDNSSDGTFEFLQQLHHEKVSLVKNNKNMGVNFNVNFGVKMIKNNYFILLGHDDVLPENYVEIGLNILLNSKAEFLFCNSICINSTGEKGPLMFSDFAQKIKYLFPRLFLCRGNFVNATGAIQSKNAFINIGGYNQNYHMSGEYLYWIKAVALFQFKFTTKIRSLYRIHDNNITASHKETIEYKKYIVACKQAALKNLFCFLRS